MNKVTAFTLVELIVVISILAILGTISFLSYGNFSIDARESKRVSNIGKIENQLDIFKTEFWKYPEADNTINIYASWSLVGKQWETGESFLRAIRISGNIYDPLDGNAFTYYSLLDGSAMQLMVNMEKKNNTSYFPISQGYAASSPINDRYPKTLWQKLWILTDQNNIPVNLLSGITSVDIINTPATYKAFLSNNEVLSWSWWELRYSLPKSSCKRLADLKLWGESWYYDITLISGKVIKVYCDFTSAWWEWLTLIARSVDDVTFNNSYFGWFVSTGSPKNDNAPYSMGNTIKEIPFENVYITVYSSGKNITGMTNIAVNDLDLFNSYNNTHYINVTNCSWEPIPSIWIPDSCLVFNKWWNFSSKESYFFSWRPYPPSTTPPNLQWNVSDFDNLASYNSAIGLKDGLSRRRFWAGFPETWMIFVK